MFGADKTLILPPHHKPAGHVPAASNVQLNINPTQYEPEPLAQLANKGADSMSPASQANQASPTNGVFPALVLNADFRPLSYSPLSLCPWEDAVRAVFRGSVSVLAEYEQVVRSPSLEMPIPSVIALREYVPAARTPAFTRFNLFLRDGWRCQYCGNKFATSNLTFDHVIPRARGGRTSWDNIVAACRPCNSKKGSDMPHECRMFPIKEPHRPTIHELQAHGRKYPPRFLHKSWRDFLYWDSELHAF